MRVITGFDEDVGRFVASQLKIRLTPPYTALGLAGDDDRLIGGVVFTSFNGSNVECTLYTPGLLKRGLIRTIIQYSFNQLGVLRLTARTKRRNKLVCKTLPRLGFVYEGTMKQYFGPHTGDDAIIYRMDRAAASKWTHIHGL